MYSLKLSALSVSTNLLKHPRLAVSQKAAPTVSLSSTHVERDSPIESSVPFPSAPIQCPGTSTCLRDTEMLTESQSSPPGEDWHLDLARRHSQSCLATSYVHRDGHAMSPDALCESEEGQSTMQSGVPVRKRKLANKRPKIPSTAATQPSRKKSKRTSKRQTADLQFTVTLHRSLASHLRSLTSYTLAQYASDAPEDEFILKTQDRMLVERLWKSLVDQGLQPIPLPSSLPSVPPTEVNPSTLNAEHVDHVPQSEPISVEGIPGLLTPPPSPTSPSTYSSAPITIPLSTAPQKDDFGNRPLLASPPRDANANINALPTPPPTPPSGSATVLAMPNLVASLILRHRERSASRPRSGSACSASVRAERGRSPLATSVLVPA